MPKSDFAKSLEKLDVEDFMSWLGVDFRITSGTSGEQLNIHTCPRCGGSDNKVFMGSESGLGNCFHGSCAGLPGFNLFTFAEHFTGTKKLAFEAIQQYQKETGWFAEKPKKKEKPKAEVFFDDVMMPESVELPCAGKNLKYLKDRGFTKETAAYFGWRFCKEGYYTYRQDDKLKQQDYSSRVIIPIRNLAGEVVTFQGRDIKGDAERKYLFPPQLPGTGRYIYNGHNAVGKKRIVIGEGAMDVAAIKQATLQRDSLADMEAVGTFGKHLSGGRGDSSDQLGALIELKRAGTEEITMMWDSEPSTIDAACKTGLSLAQMGFKVKIALLPAGKDPNEATVQEVITALFNAIPATPASVNKLRLKMRIFRTATVKSPLTY